MKIELSKKELRMLEDTLFKVKNCGFGGRVFQSQEQKAQDILQAMYDEACKQHKD